MFHGIGWAGDTDTRLFLPYSATPLAALVAENCLLSQRVRTGSWWRYRLCLDGAWEQFGRKRTSVLLVAFRDNPLPRGHAVSFFKEGSAYE